MRLAEAIFGPLIVPECRRSAGRAWGFVLRTLTAVAAASVVLIVFWWWWFGVDLDPNYQPSEAIPVGLVAIAALAIAFAVLIPPAVLAGSLAGDKERGALALLLTTRVNSWEIVTGRLGGKLAWVTTMLLAAAPFGLMMASLADLRIQAILILAGLPLVLAAGIGGLSLASSAVFRRGRDALLAIYLFLFLVLPLSLLAASSYSQELWEWIAPINPFFGVIPLVKDEDPWPSITTMIVWASLGFLGLGVAAWRLRPSCLRAIAGDIRLARKRRWRVPPVDELRPMLWKELFIERVSPLGRSGRWVALTGGLLLAGLSVGYVSVKIAEVGFGFKHESSLLFADWIGLMISYSATWISYLIELAVGLRAAVAISSEREKGTWDGLLTSPLQGPEIIVGKLLGSLYSLRWLVAAALGAWTLALCCGAMNLKSYSLLILNLITVGACLAAVGVRVSLAMPTAPKAMSITVACWLILKIGFSILSAILVAAVALTIQLVIFLLSELDSGSARFFAWSPVSFEIAWQAVRLALFWILTALVVLESRYRFDRAAGRITGGSTEVAVDKFLHGLPMAPVEMEI